MGGDQQVPCELLHHLFPGSAGVPPAPTIRRMVEKKPAGRRRSQEGCAEGREEPRRRAEATLRFAAELSGRGEESLIPRALCSVPAAVCSGRVPLCSIPAALRCSRASVCCIPVALCSSRASERCLCVAVCSIPASLRHRPADGGGRRDAGAPRGALPRLAVSPVESPLVAARAIYIR
jgi:hypothetical protein